MATNKTTNYGLNQWEGDDRVLRQEFNDDFAAIDQTLADIEGRNHVVKLVNVTTEVAAPTLDIDVSAIDFTAYREIKIIVTGLCSNGISMWLNDHRGGYYQDYSPTSGGGQATTDGTGLGWIAERGGFACGTMVSVVPAKGRCIIFQHSSYGVTSGSISYSCYYTAATEIKWQDLVKLNFSCASNIGVGSNVTVYGMR